MFVSVAIYGVAIVVFGFSHDFVLSLVALAVSGGADMVSVVIRQTLVQLDTPDAMRGRVSAVNSVFIGASNELGEFRAGTVAEWLGPTGAVVVGGVGTLIVAGCGCAASRHWHGATACWRRRSATSGRRLAAALPAPRRRAAAHGPQRQASQDSAAQAARRPRRSGDIRGVPRGRQQVVVAQRVGKRSRRQRDDLWRRRRLRRARPVFGERQRRRVAEGAARRKLRDAQERERREVLGQHPAERALAARVAAGERPQARERRFRRDGRQQPRALDA